MTKAETMKMLTFIRDYYRRFTADWNPELVGMVWQHIFAKTPFSLVEEALQAFIATDIKGFPPTPGALNALIARIAEPERTSADEAWALVVKAASNGIYNCGEEFKKLPPEVQRIVGSAGQLHEWAMMSTRDFQSVIGPGFRRSWRAMQEKDMGIYLPAGSLDRLPGD